MKDNDMIYIVDEKDEGLMIKEILKRRLNLSSRLLRKLKRSNTVYKNDESVFLNCLVESGDVVRVAFPKEESHFEPEDIPIEPVFEDDDLLIINKQPGIVVHPTKSHLNGTIANGLVNYMNQNEKPFKIRFVNRLDRDTSGLLIVGKNSFVQEELSKQMKNDQVVKKYIAVVDGILDKKEGVVNQPIKKTPGDMVRTISESGQESITCYKVIDELSSDYSVVELVLKTGRTHQIRVHMAYLGHPIVGDTLYGIMDQKIIERQALHAAYLSFIHPRKGCRIEIQAELPKDIQQILEYYK